MDRDRGHGKAEQSQGTKKFVCVDECSGLSWDPYTNSTKGAVSGRKLREDLHTPLELG